MTDILKEALTVSQVKELMDEYLKNGVDYFESPDKLKRACVSFANEHPTLFGNFLSDYLAEAMYNTEQEDVQKGFDMYKNPDY